MVKENYNLLFSGIGGPSPTPFDRRRFFLDDCLEFETTTVHKSNKWTITEEAIFPMIGPSRIFSYSMFIEPIVELRDILAYDQLIELCFAASLLNNPLSFNPILTNLKDDHMNSSMSFEFSEHPFFDWMFETIRVLNDGGDIQRMQERDIRWQTSQHNRFSPCGGGESIPSIFGALPQSTEAKRQAGESKLSHIVSILLDYCQWIDGFVGLGDNPVSEMPLRTIKKRQEEIVAEISQDGAIQFGLFRLGIFTTVATGCGLLIPGVHLRQLAVPVKNCASYNHLVNPLGNTVERGADNTAVSSNRKRKRQCATPLVVAKSSVTIDEGRHDEAMQMIAWDLGIPYFRDKIETLLVST